MAMVTLIATVGLSGCALIPQKRFYTNPVIADEKTELADPTVLFHEEVYYLYATEGSTRQIHAYTSPDLVHWTRGPLVFSPGEKGVWAPDVFFDPETRNSTSTTGQQAHRRRRGGSARQRVCGPEKDLFHKRN
jgi:sucrose-6-phosphate hydrolase SacC (GH32 family)